MDDSKTLACFGSTMGVIILAVIGYMANGFMLMILWSWFVVPLFGLPQLSIPYALGLALLSRSLLELERDNSEERSTSELWLELFSVALLRPGVTLLLGWIFQSFI